MILYIVVVFLVVCLFVFSGNSNSRSKLSIKVTRGDLGFS